MVLKSGLNRLQQSLYRLTQKGKKNSIDQFAAGLAAEKLMRGSIRRFMNWRIAAICSLASGIRFISDKSSLTTFRTIKYDPHDKIVCKVDEAVLDSCGNK